MVILPEPTEIVCHVDHLKWSTIQVYDTDKCTLIAPVPDGYQLKIRYRTHHGTTREANEPLLVYFGDISSSARNRLEIGLKNGRDIPRAAYAALYGYDADSVAYVYALFRDVPHIQEFFRFCFLETVHSA